MEDKQIMVEKFSVENMDDKVWCDFVGVYVCDVFDKCVL